MKKFVYIILFVMVSSLAFTNAERIDPPVLLKIQVLDDMGHKVHGAKVQLYISEHDYRKEDNAVRTEYTEKNGKVTFKGLDPRVYYLLVEKEKMNNNGGAVKTDTLKTWVINKVTVVIQ